LSSNLKLFHFLILSLLLAASTLSQILMFDDCILSENMWIQNLHTHTHTHTRTHARTHTQFTYKE